MISGSRAAIARDMKADPELAVRTVANRFPVEMEGFSNRSAILLIDGVARLGGGDNSTCISHLQPDTWQEREACMRNHLQLRMQGDSGR